MSQEKIDARKKNKGELLHNAKKQGRITAVAVAVVLFVLGAASSVVCYKQGYNKGQNDGYSSGVILGQYYATVAASSAEAAKNTTASSDKTDESETKAPTENSTTAAE